MNFLQDDSVLKAFGKNKEKAMLLMKKLHDDSVQHKKMLKQIIESL